MEMYPSATRMACEPMAFTIDQNVAPRLRASSMAASVSAVSPDWLMAITVVFSSTIGSRIEIRMQFPLRRDPGNSFDQDLADHAGMCGSSTGSHDDLVDRFCAHSASGLSCGRRIVPSSKSTLPARVSVNDRTCSWISFCIKCRYSPFSAETGSHATADICGLTGFPSMVDISAPCG